MEVLMKKMRLKLETLKVESFLTDMKANGYGTVFSADSETEYAHCSVDCQPTELNCGSFTCYCMPSGLQNCFDPKTNTCP